MLAVFVLLCLEVVVDIGMVALMPSRGYRVKDEKAIGLG